MAIPRAKYGAAAHKDETGCLPVPFPRSLGPNASKYIEEVLASGLTSDILTRFEEAFARELGVKHCIATPGCTPALAALAAALPFSPGDEIIVSPVTDYGTLQGLIRENYIPVFADVEPGTINFSARTIEPLITDRTRAILAVHMTGIVNDMDPINSLAGQHGLIVYEDACQSVFSEYKGRIAGTLSKAAGFSFDSEKTMGSDVGGCLATNDDDLAERIRFIGQSRGGVMKPHYGRLHTEPGYAYRMPLCTAAICLAQLEVIRPQVAQRDKMARLLTALLAEIPGIVPYPIPDYCNVYSCWMFGFSIDPEMFECSGEEFARQLAAEGVPGAGQGKYYLMPEALTFLAENAAVKKYPYSMPPASREYHYSGGNCPNAKAFLENYIRWSTFCDRYEESHCELAAEIVARVAERNRRR
jgi:dTDP-4-amino-4,6-dideoxygalactose transaminase